MILFPKLYARIKWISKRMCSLVRYIYFPSFCDYFYQVVPFFPASASSLNRMEMCEEIFFGFVFLFFALAFLFIDENICVLHAVII